MHVHPARPAGFRVQYVPVIVLCVIYDMRSRGHGGAGAMGDAGPGLMCIWPPRGSRLAIGHKAAMALGLGARVLRGVAMGLPSSTAE